MNRFKSYALWAAVLAFIPLISEALGTYNVSLVLPGNYDVIVTALLGILVLAGIITNPSKGKGFTDKEDE